MTAPRGFVLTTEALQHFRHRFREFHQQFTVAARSVAHASTIETRSQAGHAFLDLVVRSLSLDDKFLC